MKTIQTVTLPRPNQAFQRKLVHLFGGYTRQGGTGEWWDPIHERTVFDFVTIFTIAFNTTTQALDNFRALIFDEGVRQGQDEVFYTINGEAHFMDLRSAQIPNQAA